MSGSLASRFSWRTPSCPVWLERLRYVFGSTKNPCYVEGAAFGYRTPIVDALSVAAARVEHSSLRNRFSTWVRTVLGLRASSLAASLLLAPRLMRRSTSVSRGERRTFGGAKFARSGGRPSAASNASTTPGSKRPFAVCSRSSEAASERENAVRHGRGARNATNATEAARIRASNGNATPPLLRK